MQKLVIAVCVCVILCAAQPVTVQMKRVKRTAQAQPHRLLPSSANAPPAHTANDLTPWRFTRQAPPPHWAEGIYRQLASSASTALTGSAVEDFVSEVQVGSQSFTVTMDTGSGTFAVAGAMANSGCQDTLSSSVPCTGAVPKQSYGSGSWSGTACNGVAEVSIAGKSAGKPNFARMDHEYRMLTCPAEIKNTKPTEGIMGLSFCSSLPDPTKCNPTLFDSLIQNNPGMSNELSMQCCGWDTDFDKGTVTFGGTDSSQYTGSIQYTPVTVPSYWCVDLQSVAMGSSRRLTSVVQQPSALDGTGASTCTTIVDSGTSALMLSPTNWAVVESQLPAAALNSQNFANHCVTEAEVDSYPPIILKLQGDVTLTVTSRRYMQPWYAPFQINTLLASDKCVHGFHM